MPFTSFSHCHNYHIYANLCIEFSYLSIQLDSIMCHCSFSYGRSYEAKSFICLVFSLARVFVSICATKIHGEFVHCTMVWKWLKKKRSTNQYDRCAADGRLLNHLDCVNYDDSWWINFLHRFCRCEDPLCAIEICEQSRPKFIAIAYDSWWFVCVCVWVRLFFFT